MKKILIFGMVVCICLISFNVWAVPAIWPGYDGKITAVYQHPHKAENIDRRSIGNERTQVFDFPVQEYGTLIFFVNEYSLAGILVKNEVPVNLRRPTDKLPLNVLFLGYRARISYVTGSPSVLRVELEKTSKPAPGIFHDWPRQYCRAAIDHYSTGGRELDRHELRKVSREILSNGENYSAEDVAWAWAMMVELTARSGSGTEQFARWGLLLSRYNLSAETRETVEERIAHVDGARAQFEQCPMLINGKYVGGCSIRNDW